MTRRRPSSSRWLLEHRNDPYVQAAHREGYRSRAAYKLLELHQRFSLLKPGMTVLDLGAAPGGWSQVVVKVGAGRVVAMDRLAMDAIPGVTVLRGDFLDDAGIRELLAAMGGEGAHLVLSDMAPEMTGFTSVDQARGELLAESAFDLLPRVLRPGGSLVLKLFQGPAFHTLVRQAQGLFQRVKVVKPEASRDRSAEHYLVAFDFRPVSPGRDAGGGVLHDSLSK